MNVKFKISLIIALPLLALLGFSITHLMKLDDNVDHMTELASLIELSIETGQLIHPLQAERGMSAAFVDSDGEDFANRIKAQRRKVDERIGKLREQVNKTIWPQNKGEEIRREIDEMLVDLDRLSSTRTQVDKLQLSAHEVLERYNNIVEHSFLFAQNLANFSESSELTNYLTAYGCFVRGKNEMGLERSAVAEGLHFDTFSPALLTEYVEHRLSSQNYMQIFESFGSEEITKEYERAKDSETFRNVAEVEQAILQDNGQGPYETEPVEWFSTISEKIEKMFGMQQQFEAEVLAQTQEQVASEEAAFLQYSIIVISVLALSIILAIFVARGILRNIKRLGVGARELANGHLEHRVDVDSNDELGQLSTTFNNMAEDLQKKNDAAAALMAEGEKQRQEIEIRSEESRKQQEYLTQQVERIAAYLRLLKEKDFSQDLTAEQQDIIADLIEDLAATVVSLRSTIADIQTVANDISSATLEISESAGEMTQTIGEQDRQMQDIAAAMEEMSSTVSETAGNTSSAAELVQVTVDEVDKGRKLVSQTREGMVGIEGVVQQTRSIIGKLGDSSKQIGSVIQVIEDIADQTNLLALNAAIEAARAGESGRGFAVVADEVRKLAERTQQATKQITGTIVEIQADTETAVNAATAGSREVNEGIALADSAQEALEQLVHEVEKVDNFISQIATAAEQQSATTQQISHSVAVFTEASNDNARRVEEISHSVNDLAQQADTLNGMASEFVIESTSRQTLAPQRKALNATNGRWNGKSKSSNGVHSNGVYGDPVHN